MRVKYSYSLCSIIPLNRIELAYTGIAHASKMSARKMLWRK